jgi:hypothetical protein
LNATLADVKPDTAFRFHVSLGYGIAKRRATCARDHRLEAERATPPPPSCKIAKASI